MALRLLVAHTPAEQAAARALEAQVFLQSFGNTPEVLAAEYGPYDARSRFITVLDEESGIAVGVVRVILPDGDAPVKTLVDAAQEPWGLDIAEVLRAEGLTGQPVVDIATMAVDPRFRSGAGGAEVLVAICHGTLSYIVRCGLDGEVTILDDRVLGLLQAMGMPWRPLPGATSQPYLGSPASTPCVIHVAESVEKARRPGSGVAPGMLDGGFRSITCDPDDLSPARGGGWSTTTTPAVSTPRDTRGWQRPGLRRSDVDRTV